MIANRWFLGLALTTLLLAPADARAGVIYQVSLDTAPLVGNAAGPFSLDFQLNGSGNNTAILSNFQFGGGAADTFGNGPWDGIFGAASGNLNSSITLTDTVNFSNEFTQQFTPGSTLSFQISLTTNVAAPIPDQFSFGILDSAGNDIPMPVTDFTASFLVITLNSSTSPQVQTFANDPTTPDPAGGGIIGATGLLGVTPVPEPTSLTLLAVGMMTLCGWRVRVIGKRRREFT